MNVASLTLIILLLVGAIILIWNSSVAMIKKKKVFIFLPWLIAGFFYCLFAGFFIEGLGHFANDFGLVVKLFTYSMMLYIFWRER